MHAAPTDLTRIACPGCGGTFDVPSRLGGKHGRCAKCGAKFLIPRRKSPTADEAQLIGVACHICSTPLYGRQEHVGRLLKCPDCGAATRLPPPPRPQPKDIPAAMEGPQYELWDDQQEPVPRNRSDESAAFPVPCELCETLMYARRDQVGERLICPDCGRATVVRQPPPNVPAKPVLVPIGSDYQPDPSKPPPERPRVLSAEKERQIQSEKEIRRRKKRRLDARGRPVLPRLPLLTGWAAFLAAPGVIPRWLGLSLAIVPTGFLMLAALDSLGGLGAPSGAGFVGTSMGAISGFFFLIASLVLAMLIVSALAAMLLAIVVESSEGNDEVHDWPPHSPLEWFPQLAYLLMTCLVSAFPGWLLARLLARDAWEQVLWQLGGFLWALPIVLLSQLAASSVANVLAWPILKTIGRLPFTWSLFYLESAGLAALGLVPLALAGARQPLLAVCLAPWLIALLLLYSRLLGRLGWTLAERAK